MTRMASLSLLGAGAATTMFFLDPVSGTRRRALMRDQIRRAARKVGDAAEATRRDVDNRLQGVAATLRAQSTTDAVSDRVLSERVRAALGRVASHPRAIRVTACDGGVRLDGDLLASELPSVITAVENVRGVTSVDNQLVVHLSADGIPSLQGESSRPDWWSAWFRSGWPPAGILAACSAATAIVLAAMMTRR